MLKLGLVITCCTNPNVPLSKRSFSTETREGTPDDDLHLEDTTFDQLTVCLADPLRCHLTPSIRGNPILWDSSGNTYYRIKTSLTKLKSAWKCRQPGCKARVHTNDVSNVIIKITNQHLHCDNLADETISNDMNKNVSG